MLLFLLATHTTLNVMSLMGVLMLVGISASNSILIVEFTHRLEEQGKAVEEAVITSCRVRLRPILMTSLATIIGMVPMALKLGTGSEQYAPLARAVLGGMSVSLMMTVIMVPAAYYVAYRKDATLSSYCQRFVSSLRDHMEDLVAAPKMPVAQHSAMRRAARRK